VIAKRLAGGLNTRLYFLARRLAPDRFSPEAFHCDRVYQQIMVELAAASGVSAFVETGTFKGVSAAFIADRCPAVPVHTIEIEPSYYAEAAARLHRYPSVRLAHGSSPPWLAALLDGGTLGDRPLFYLDAHWYEDWPLPAEIELIASRAREAIIVIDDFQVPGRVDFGFDTYAGRACNLDLVRTHLGPQGRHRFVFPRYTSRDAFGMRYLERLLNGWIIVFQDLDDLFEDFVRRPSIASLVTTAERS